MQLTRNEILRYIKLIKEKRYLFIILSLSIMSVIVWGSYFIPKKYKAKSTIFIERNVIEDLVKGIAITPSMDARIKVLRDTMLRRSILLDVVRKLDMDAEVSNDKEVEEIIAAVKGKTRIVVRKSSLIDVAFVNRDPVLARKYVNTLVSAYVEKNIFAKREEAYDATDFLAKQVAFFKKKIDDEEYKIIKFRKEQGIYVAMDELSYIDEIKVYGKELEAITIKNKELTASKNSIERQLKGEEPFTVTMYSNTGIKSTLKSLENKLRMLLIKYTDKYPEVIRLKAEIEALKSEQQHETMDQTTGSEISAANPIYQELKQKLNEINSNINSIDAKEEHLQSLIKKKKELLGNVPEKRKKLADMVRERNSYKDIHGQLLERLGQSEVSKQMEVEDKSTTFRVIEPAVLPTIPVSPPRKALIFFGILFGFAGSIGVILIMDRLDYSMKSVDTVKLLGLPVLAVIPKIKGPKDVYEMGGKEVLIYSFAGLYLICIIGVFTMEVLGITLIDDFISSV